MMPGHGIQVQPVMAWLTNVMLRNAFLTHPPVPPSEDPHNFGGGAWNMRLLYAVVLYVFAWRANQQGLAAARLRLMLLLDRELVAHSGDEPLSASHNQLHVGAMGAALKECLIQGDHEAAQRIIAWFRIEYAIYRTCEHGQPWLPGGRGFLGTGKARRMIGINPTRIKVVAAVETGKVAGKVNQYDMGAHCLATLPGAIREAIREWPQAFPPMWAEFHARRYADGRFYAFFGAEPAKWKDAVRSAGHDGTELWISQGVDHERMLAYGNDVPVLIIDAPAADLSKLERP